MCTLTGQISRRSGITLILVRAMIAYSHDVALTRLGRAYFAINLFCNTIKRLCIVYTENGSEDIQALANGLGFISSVR